MQQPVRLSWSPWGTVSGGGHVNRDVSHGARRAGDWLQPSAVKSRGRIPQQPAYCQ